MNKETKFLLLLLISLSVYFIYQNTKDSTYQITCIGDKLSLGINSYGIKEYGYLDYLKDEMKDKKKNININNNFSNKSKTIKEVLYEVKENEKLKGILMNSNLIILNVGYNDLLYNLSIEDSINNNKITNILNEISNNYKELILEIRKYYKKEIIVIGYYNTQDNDYYINIGTYRLNKILSNSNEIKYIDTYYLLNNRNKYFSNPNSYYPNRLGYKVISEKIITTIK